MLVLKGVMSKQLERSCPVKLIEVGKGESKK